MLFILIPLVLIVLFFVIRKRRPRKRVVFVGPRGSYKTRTLFRICRGEDVRTVPTLKDYSLKYTANTDVCEQVPRNTQEISLKYGIQDKNAKYFFFINSVKDIHRFDGFDVTFVYWRSKEDIKDYKETQNVLFLQGNPMVLPSRF
eukprot:jgi/Antlo1/404/892